MEDDSNISEVDVNDQLNTFGSVIRSIKDLRQHVDESGDILFSDDTDSEDELRELMLTKLNSLSESVYKVVTRRSPKKSIWKSLGNPFKSEGLGFTTSTADSVIDSHHMAKRKREEISSSDEEGPSHQKKRSVNDNASSKTRRESIANQKQNSHHLSSSEDEDTLIKSQFNEPEKNGSSSKHQQLTSDSENECSSIKEIAKKNEKVLDKVEEEKHLYLNKPDLSENELSEDFDLNSCSIKSGSIVSTHKNSSLVKKSFNFQEKQYCEPKLTNKDEEQTAKCSFLLEEDLAENYNIWILQCPANMDCLKLKEQSLDLSGCGSCEFAVGNQRFESYSYPADQSNQIVTLAVPSERNNFELCRLPVAGSVIVEEAVDFSSSSSFTVPEVPIRVHLPQNLRTRHPLLGLNYIKQSKTMRTTNNKKTGNKYSRIMDESLDGDNEPEFSSPSEYLVTKKKKKHKNMEDRSCMSQDIETELSSSSMTEHSQTKKKKKKKHKNFESSEETCQDLETELSSSSFIELSQTKKKKKHKNVDSSEETCDLEQHSSTSWDSPKKKKKIKDSNINDLSNSSLNEECIEEVHGKKKVKNKKKKNVSEELRF